MIDTRAVGEELQEMQRRMTSRFRKRQEMVTATIRTWAQAAQAVRPQLPSLPGTEALTRLPKPQDLAERLPRPHDLASRLPKPQDLAERLPRPQEIAGQLIAGQRRLAGQVMPLARQGAAALAHGMPGRAPSPVRSTTPKITRQKATGPKTTGSKPAASKAAGTRATGRESGAQRGSGTSNPRSAEK
jgi:hypothetical protein